MPLRILTLFLLFLSTVTTALACTTWASIGKISKNQGLLIVKNRDGAPSSLQKLRYFKPAKGYPYLCLMYRLNHKHKEFPFLSAGINQAGVVVVNNAASTTKTIHRDQNETITLMKILRHYGSVAAVLKAQNTLFSTGLVNDILIGDKHQIALVEMGHNGNYFIWKKKNGYLYHTNTYVSQWLKPENKMHFPDSMIRYKRIGHLLRTCKKPFSFQEFWNMSNDRNNPINNNNLFRPLTMATWIVAIPKRGAPTLYLRFTDPSQRYNVYQLKLDKQFWKHPVLKGEYDSLLKAKKTSWATVQNQRAARIH